MGQEPGWITDDRIWEGVSPGAARNAMLKAAGNGVVTLQAAVALADMKRSFEAMDTHLNQG